MVMSSRENLYNRVCWATPISVSGAVMGVLAANEVRKGNLDSAAGLATLSALADLFDGKEARRYAKRYPEKAKIREGFGKFIDQFLDKVRNISIGAAMTSCVEIEPIVRVAAGAITARETLTFLGGVAGAINYKLK